MEVIDREKVSWDQHEEFDWMAESSKRNVVATPRNQILARVLYWATAMGRSSFPQSFFVITPTRQ
jgi:hypothetical protein